MPIDFSGRVQNGERYLRALATSLTASWIEQYEAYNHGALSLGEALSLAHPWHYEELHGANTVRSDRRFAAELGGGRRHCSADIFWGYTCLGPGEEADHKFPYSLGGTTVATNKVYLCRFHNQMKSSDVHLFPWEDGEPIWLAECLTAIKKLKDAGMWRSNAGNR